MGYIPVGCLTDERHHFSSVSLSSAVLILGALSVTLEVKVFIKILISIEVRGAYIFVFSVHAHTSDARDKKAVVEYL